MVWRAKVTISRRFILCLYEDEFLKLFRVPDTRVDFISLKKLLMFMINYRIITYVFGIILFLCRINCIYSTVGLVIMTFISLIVSNLNVDVIFELF